MVLITNSSPLRDFLLGIITQLRFAQDERKLLIPSFIAKVVFAQIQRPLALVMDDYWRYSR